MSPMNLYGLSYSATRTSDKLSVVLVILFLCKKKLQHMINYDGWVVRHKLATLIYVSPAHRHR
jgi:hypothetical protein